MPRKAPLNGIATQFKSGEKAAEIGRKGGIASGKSKRRKKSMSEMATMMMESALTERNRKAISEMCGDLPEDDMTIQSAMVAGQIKAAINGSTSAFSALTELADREQQKKEAAAAEKAARDAADYRTDLHHIADSFHPLIRDIREKRHREYLLDGGRGSTKSTTVFTLLYEVLKNNPQMHALVVRQVANTLRDSVYAQMQWSLEKQDENPLFDRDNWRFKVSPLEIEYKPTGQKIYFRGADDPGKIKSIKVPFGYIGVLISSAGSVAWSR